MGGHAFPPSVACRLTTAQLDLFTAWCIERLVPDVFAAVDALRSLRSKETHGDLDLRCGWDGVESTDELVGHELAGGGYARQVINAGPDMSVFCDDVERAIRGIRWRRNKNLISVGVPVRAVFPDLELETEGPMEPFYQVDLLLAPSKALPFISLVQSYHDITWLLPASLKKVSKTFRLRSDRMTFRQVPFANQTPIEFDLTDDLETFCAWAGLDLERWERGFDTQEEVWEWLTTLDVPQQRDPAHDPAKIANAEMTKGHIPVLVHAWIAIGQDWRYRPPATNAILQLIDTFMKWIRIPGKRWYQPPPSSRNADLAHSAPHEEVDPALDDADSAPKPPSYLVRASPLDVHARAALLYFGKLETYEILKEDRRKLAQRSAYRQADRAALQARSPPSD